MGSEEEVHVGTTYQTVLDMDSGEKRLNELGYKQELRRDMVIIYNICYSRSSILNLARRTYQSFFFFFELRICDLLFSAI